MAVKSRGRPKLPSSSLPPLKEIAGLSATEIGLLLRDLHDLFCPLPTTLDFQTDGKHALLAADSGYASETDVDGSDVTEHIRADKLEREFTVRWLTGFIGRAFELSPNEDTAQRFVDEACAVLSYLANEADEGIADDDDLGMTREFQFALGNEFGPKIKVQLNDTPMQTGEDHTDVGLQTWGASIAVSDKISKDPAAFRINRGKLNSNSRIVELGAGTGLVSLFLSRLVPHLTESWPTILATDYHPTVLSNLQANIATHMAEEHDSAPVQACHLDWSAPSREAPLDVPADMMVAADVTYAPEHATWLRDCAKTLLADDGVFWLMVSVRPNGKFAGISDSVEKAFSDVDKCARPDDGRVLKIASVQRIEKRGSVGRADEIGYKLFEIIWS